MTDSSNSQKDVLYIDGDDEITAIIDKVRSSHGRVVALVLPKRASVLQSIVNMKLLKRSADQSKKHLVLITGEPAIISLAGTVEMYVAKTPQSKPEIPVVSEPEAVANDDNEAVELSDEAEEGYTAENAGDKPIGELAGIEELDMTAETVENADAADSKTDQKVADEPKVKRPKVPNFNKFRLGLFIAIIAVILLVAGLFYALKVMPRATINVKTNASQVNADITFTLDKNATKLDASNMVVPAKSESQQDSSSKQVPATGQQNNGDNATGSVDISVIKCQGNPFTLPDDIPAGTGVSTSGLTYITQEDASFSGSVMVSPGCYKYDSDNISITAQSAGKKYNVDSAKFAVAGDSSATATGSASGGTDDIVKVVSQSDIDNAKKQLAAKSTDSIKADLEQTLIQDGLYPISQTFKAADPLVTTSSKVGDPADNVTVTQVINYTMYGAEKSLLQTLVKQSITSQIDTESQSILDDGLDNATISVISNTDSTVKINLKSTAQVGPDINVSALKTSAAGKKSGEVKGQIMTQPGVTSVDIKLSPFWVSSVPNNLNKITVNINQPTISLQGNNP